MEAPYRTALDAANAADETQPPAAEATSAEPVKKKPAAPKKRRKRRAKRKAKAVAAPAAPPTVSSVFAPFAEQLRAIDWRDPVKREAEVGAILGQMLVAVATAPQLTDADREKLQWLMQLSRQMISFRDASAIEAARRALAGDDDAKPDNVEGPQLEPAVVVSEPSESENSERRAGPAFRGRPRSRALA